MSTQPSSLATEHCPWCETPITHRKFVQIETRIRKHEYQQLERQRVALEECYQKQAEETATTLKNAHEQALATKIAEAEASQSALREQLDESQRRSQDNVTAITAQRDAAIKNAEAVQADAEKRRTEAVVAEVQKAQAQWQQEHAAQAEQASRDQQALQGRVKELLGQRDDTTLKLTEALEECDAAKRRAEETGAATEVRIKAASDAAALRARESALAEHETLVRDAATQLADTQKELATATEQMNAIQAEAAIHTKEVVQEAETRVRATMEEHHTQVLTERSVEATRDREALHATVRDLQRKLEQKTSNELGEGAELDLYETLREQFPGDSIQRIERGKPGADIRFEVRNKGAACGVILIDSKNRKQWKNEHAIKLRADQVEANAEYAILAALKFPKGKKELCEEANVLVAAPARVPELVRLLRKMTVRSHALQLSTEERTQKRQALYAFVTSDEYGLKTDEVRRLNTNLQDLDVDEQTQHRRLWKKRGTLVKQQERAIDAIDVAVTAILSGPESAPASS